MGCSRALGGDENYIKVAGKDEKEPHIHVKKKSHSHLTMTKMNPLRKEEEFRAEFGCTNLLHFGLYSQSNRGECVWTTYQRLLETNSRMVWDRWPRLGLNLEDHRKRYPLDADWTLGFLARRMHDLVTIVKPTRMPLVHELRLPESAT